MRSRTIVAALALTLVACASMRESASTSEFATAETSPVASAAPREGPLPQRDSETLPVGTSPRRGPDSAVVTIVEFGDFECSFCARAQPVLRALEARYAGNVRIVWKDTPLSFHHHAVLAAEAAREAFAQRGNEGFFAMHDLLFANQRQLEFDDLVRYAEQIGLDATRFRTALEQHTHEPLVRADLAFSNLLRVRGTPAFAINGTWITGARPEREFVAVIDAVLARARTIEPRDTVYAAMVEAPLATPRPPTPVYRVATNPQAPTRGNANAPVVIELFSDFECPFCARVQPTVERLLRERPNDVVIHHRDYPLPFHAHAQLAAEAAREAFAQRGNDGFARYAALLYAHRDALERSDLEDYARELQLDMRRFRDALDRRTHASEVHADVLAADATHAQIGTPAFFVNGHFRAGAMPYEELSQLVDEATRTPPRGAP
jgi:protein-disulfide isomerase